MGPRVPSLPDDGHIRTDGEGKTETNETRDTQPQTSDRAVAKRSKAAAHQVMAATGDVRGDQEGAWTLAGGPYIITGDVTVPQGRTLTIEPGVEVRFDGNYGIRVQGTLTADGTPSSQITFTSNKGSPARGDWKGVWLQSTSGQSLLDNCLLQYGGSDGGWGGANICVDGVSSVTVSDTVSRYSYDTGLTVRGSADPAISNCEFAYNRYDGLAVETDSYPDLSSLSVHDNDRWDGIVVYGGHIDRSGTWTAQPVPYVIDDYGSSWGNRDIASGVTLTIEPGAVLKLEDTGGVSFSVYGALKAEGTADDHVVFTSLADDSVMGDTNGNGSSAGESRDWADITFESGSAGSVLRYCDFQYGGNASSAVGIFTSSLVFENCTITDSGDDGLRVTGNVSPTITDLTVRDTGDHGVYVGGGAGPTFNRLGVYSANADGVWVNGDATRTTLNDVTVDGAGDDGLDLVGPTSVTNAMVRGTSDWAVELDNVNNWGDLSGLALDAATCARGNAVWVGGGSLPGNAAPQGGVVWVFNWDITVPVNTMLTLQPNTALKHDGGTLNVYGTLTARGTAQEPILFTSYHDDTARAGGDTNDNETGSTPARGNWGGIFLGDGSDASVLENVEVWYAGDGIRVDSSAATLTDVKVKEARWTGLVARNAASPTVSGFEAVGCGDDGIRVEQSATQASLDDITVSDVSDVGIILYADTSLTNATVSNTGSDGLAVLGGAEVTVSNLTVRNAGADGVWVNDDANPITLTNVIVDGAQDDGLDLEGRATVTGAALRDVDDWPVYLFNVGDWGRVSGLSIDAASCSRGNAGWFVAGELPADATPQADVLWAFNRDITVPTGVTLTLLPGTTLKPDGGGLVVNGTLNAQGTEEKPILITSFRDDAAGGDTNADGANSTPGRGNWWEVQFNAGSDAAVLQHAAIRYGSMIRVNGASPSLSNVAAQHVSSVGLRVEGAGAGPTVSHLRVEDSGWEGVYVANNVAQTNLSDVTVDQIEGTGMEFRGPVTLQGGTISNVEGHGIYVTENFARNLSDVVIQNAGDDGVRVDGNAGFATLTNVTVNGSQDDGIELLGPGSISGANIRSVPDWPIRLSGVGTWPGVTGVIIDGGTCARGKAVWVGNGELPANASPQGDMVWVLNGELKVPAGVTLTLSPGTVIKYDGGSLLVEGTLNARGNDPILFTSFRDDSVEAGGDTNLDGSNSTPVAGNWGAATFAPGSSSSVLEHVEFRYGAGGWWPYATVLVEGSSPTFSHVTIRDSEDHGLRIHEGGAPTISDLTIQNCRGDGVWVTDNAGSGTRITNVSVSSVTDDGFDVWSPATIQNAVVDGVGDKGFDVGPGVAIVGASLRNVPDWPIWAHTDSWALISGITIDLATCPRGQVVALHEEGILAADAAPQTDVTWRLEGDVTVPAGKTLTLAAGARLEFLHSSLTVDGILIVNGALAQPVVFTSADGVLGHWGNVTLGDGVARTDLGHLRKYSNGAVTTADMDNDGITDAVGAGYQALAVFRRWQDGDFTEVQDYELTDFAASDVVVGRFNSDAFLDVATANGETNDVAVLLNNGDGTLGAVVRYPAGQNPVALVVADLNKDGLDDLVTADNTGNTVSMLRNLGNGVFAAPQQVAVGTEPKALAAGDFNEDNRVDILVGHNAGNQKLGLLTGAAGGTLNAPVWLPFQGTPGGLAVQDLDGDSHLDAAISDNANGEAVVLFGVGNGTFVTGAAYATGDSPVNVATLDINLDGVTDLAVRNTATGHNTITVLKGLGGRAFTDFGEYPISHHRNVYGNANYPLNGLATADFDGDGRDDMIAAHQQLYFDGDFWNWYPRFVALTPDLPQPPSVLNYFEISHAGDNSGALYLSNGTAQITNGYIHDVEDAGLAFSNGGAATATNNLITRCGDAGVIVQAHANPLLANNTIDGNYGGILFKTGAGNIFNNIVSFNTQYGIRGESDPYPQFTYNDVFNPEARDGNYDDMDDLTGVDGNLMLDPGYVDREDGDYHLASNAGPIDAGQGANAPAADREGKPRFDDPNMANVGAGQPPYVDLGAFERQIMSKPVNLLVDSLTFSVPQAEIGDSATLTWTVRSVEEYPAEGNWRDAVFFSTDAVWDIDDELLTEVTHTGGLASGHSYQAQTAVTVPPGLPGELYLIVRADVRQAVRESVESDNLSAVAIPVNIPELPLNGSAQTTLTTDRPDRYFKVVIPQETVFNEDMSVALLGELAIDLQTLTGGGIQELYVGRDRIPSPVDYDERSVEPSSEQRVSFFVAPGSYYVLAVGAALPDDTANVRLTTEIEQLTVDSVTPGAVGNSGTVTLEVRGQSLTAGTLAELVAGETVVPALDVFFGDASSLYATFDLTGVAAGNYHVRVKQQFEGLVTVQDPNDPEQDIAELRQYDLAAVSSATLQVIEGGASEIEIDLALPSRLRVGRDFEFTLTYRNTGNVDALAPVIVLDISGDGKLYDPATDYPTAHSLMILGTGALGQAGILALGETRTVTLKGLAPTQGTEPVSITASVPDRPSGGPNFSAWVEALGEDPGAAPWSDVVVALNTALGPTWTDFSRGLSQLASQEVIPGDARPVSVRGLIDGVMVSTLEGSAPAQSESSAESDASASLESSDAASSLRYADRNAAESLASDVWTPSGSSMGIQSPSTGAPEVRVWDTSTNRRKKLTGKRSLDDEAAPIYPVAPDTTFWPIPYSRPEIEWMAQKAFISSVITGFDVREGLWEVASSHASTYVNAGAANQGTVVHGPSSQASYLITSSGQNQIRDFRTGVQQPVLGVVRAYVADQIGRYGDATYFTDFDILKVPVPNLNGRNGISVLCFWENGWRSPGVNFALAAGFGGMQGAAATGEHFSAVKEGDGYRVRGILHYVFIDRYEFDDDDYYKGVYDKTFYEWGWARTFHTPDGDYATGAGFDTMVVIEKPFNDFVRVPTNPDTNPDAITPEGGEGTGAEANLVASFDPNDKVGPAGAGEGNFIRPGGEMPYTVFFENDPEFATAPAQRVVIEDQLSANLDWTTFELGSFSFGNITVAAPQGMREYSTSVDTTNQDGTPLRVNITGSLDLNTGMARWVFDSIDPETGAPPSAWDAGFLPVNDATHIGEGHVTYSVLPKSGLASGAEIGNQANIHFDANAPILTPTTLNTMDVGTPSSRVTALPAEVGALTFPVQWTGQDDAGGSGIGSYDIYVSDNGGSWTRWLDHTADTSASYTGQLLHTYRFYSVARDQVGYEEAAPGAADASTTVQANTAPTLTTIAPFVATPEDTAYILTYAALAQAADEADADGDAVSFRVESVLTGTLTKGGVPVTPGETLLAAGESLVWTPAQDANGALNALAVKAWDGWLASDTALTITANVTAVNDVPSFAVGADQVVNEDAGPQVVTGWATGISPGPADESGQACSFWMVSVTNGALFSVSPAVSPLGTLAYTPAANANGAATVTVRLRDNGGTSNGGQDTSAEQTFTIAVTPVNDAPSFVSGADQSVIENTGAQTVANWATGRSAGPADEAGQTLGFLVTNDNNALFSTQPAVDANGTLTFTPVADTIGTATVTVRARDNGGTANGGQDTSPPQTFTIRVRPTPIVLTPTNRRYTFQDNDGDTVTVSFGGPAGSATLQRGVRAGQPGDLETIAFAGTGAKTALAVAVKERKGTTDRDGTTVQGITGSGLGTLDMKNVDLVGNTINLTGSLGKLVVDDILNGSHITLGGAATSALTLTADQVGEVNLSFPGILKSATVGRWTGGTIQVARLDSLTVKSGTLGANVTASERIGAISVKSGSLTGDIVARNASGQTRILALGSVAVTGGDIAGSITVENRGNAGAIMAKTARNVGGGDIGDGQGQDAIRVDGQLKSVSADRDIRAAIVVDNASGSAKGNALGLVKAIGGSLFAAVEVLNHGNLGTLQAQHIEADVTVDGKASLVRTELDSVFQQAPQNVKAVVSVGGKSTVRGKNGTVKLPGEGQAFVTA